MEEIILYLCIRYSFNWMKVVKAMQNNIEVKPEEFQNISNDIMVNYITILQEENYPKYLQFTLNPPLALFYLGDLHLFDKKRVVILGHINSNNVKYLKILANLDYVLCFTYEQCNEKDFEWLTKTKLPVILYTKTLQNTKVANPLWSYLKITKNLAISEALGNDYLFSNWQFLRLFFDHSDKLLIISEIKNMEEFTIDWINEHCGFIYFLNLENNCFLLNKIINSKEIKSINHLKDSFI